MPDWYWEKGLHDAVITSYEIKELDYDYKEKNPLRNYLKLNINSKGAMFDTAVKTIKFYNFKTSQNLEGIINAIWFEDRLTKEGQKFKLEIDLNRLKNNADFTINITFDLVEVER